MVRPKNYDADGYIHFISKNSSETRQIKVGEDKKRMIRDKIMYEIDFDYIESINLNKVGNEIPYTNNVVNLERYMMYYWKPIIGSDAILLYLHLWDINKQKDDGVDIVYPKVTELMKRFQVSKPKLLTDLGKLEDNNFLLVFHRLNKRNNNREDSPIIKLRRTIPMLDKEQYYRLTPYLQKRHDEYMDKFATNMQLELWGQRGDETIDSIVKEKGDLVVTKKMREEINKAIESEEAEEYIKQHLPLSMADTLRSSRELVDMLIDSRYGGKPTCEHYFLDSFTLYNEATRTIHLIAKDDTHKFFIEEHLKHNLAKLILHLNEWYGGASSLKVFSRSQYVVKLRKGEL